jgi:hypothetical protein
MNASRIRLIVLLGLLAAVAVAAWLAQPRTKLVMMDGHLCEFYETHFDNGHPRQRFYLIHAEQNAVRHGIDTSWYDNGNKMSEVHHVYGDFEGPMRTWWPSGNLQWEAHFADDVPHGSFEQWFDSGQMRTQRFFKNGLCDGLCRVWHENGKVRIEFTANADSYHGVRRVWNEHGALRAEQSYQHGICIGEWTVWSDEGRVLARGRYIDGEPCEGTFAMLDRRTEDYVVIDVEQGGVVVDVLPGSYGDVLPHTFASTAMWNQKTPESPNP